MFFLLQTTVPAFSEDTPWWAKVLFAAFMVVVTYLLVPLLRNKAYKARAEAAVAEGRSNAQLKLQVQEFAYMAAANIAERNFPRVARMIVEGKFTDAVAVRDELYRWGEELMDDVVFHFSSKQIDIVAELGEEYIKHVIDSAANSVSPFPGKETAKELIQTGVADLILREGVEFVRRKYRNQLPPNGGKDSNASDTDES